MTKFGKSDFYHLKKFTLSHGKSRKDNPVIQIKHDVFRHSWFHNKLIIGPFSS